MKEKLLVIKNAYGEHYDKCNPDENGWTTIISTGENIEEKEIVEKCGILYFRPKALTGIDNNNGWISTTHELPIMSDFYHVEIDNIIFESNPIAFFNVEFKEWYIGEDCFNVTRWQEIKCPKKSLY